MDSNTPTFDQQRTYSSQNLSLSAQESRYSLDINKRIFPDSREGLCCINILQDADS